MKTPVTGGDSPTPVIEIDRLQKSMEVGQGLKFVCDLSTLLVATIQEAKDRISQVEYIFCSQLYPIFQKNSKSIQNLYVEARKAAEEECKEMHLKMVGEMKELYLARENLLRKTSELEEKLLLKDLEVEEGKELHKKLQEVIESKTSDVESKQKLLRQYEERLSSLFTNTRELEEEKCQLKEELGTKSEDLKKGKELQEEMLRCVSSQGEKILRLEELLQYNANERKNLASKLQNVEACLNDLSVKFGTKTTELDECRKWQEQLVQQNDVNISKLTNKEQLLTAHEKEKALLLSRLKDLENKTEELQVKDWDVAAFPEKSEYCKLLLQKVERKHSELLNEKQKRRDLLNAYKSLKSQYNFLCARSGLTAENALLKPKLEAEIEPHGHDAIKNLTSVSKLVPRETANVKEISSSGSLEEEKNSRSNQTEKEVRQPTKVKKEMESGSDSDDERGVRSNQASIIGAPSISNSLAASKWKTSRNASSSASGKPPTSDWRATRPRQTPNGPDPHDDFLNTPLENIRGNLAKSLREAEEEAEEEVPNIPAPVSRDMECDNSDDEMVLNISAEAVLSKQQPQALKRSPKGFKYVEPVRKKAQREALKGIECKQCKKFYDAVLPDGEDQSNTGNCKKGFRCEHLDGVSRHRYRYAPPMTPEGFWNIGFDSEI